MYLIPAVVFFPTTSTVTPGYFFSNAALNFPERSFGKEVTTTTFPEAAKEFEANNKAIKIANSFFMLSPLVYLTLSVLELKFAFNKKR